MYVARIPNRNSPPAYLLRESYRENGCVKNRTVANISHLPIQQIQLLSRVLKGEQLLPVEAADDGVVDLETLAGGHLDAVPALFVLALAHLHALADIT